MTIEIDGQGYPLKDSTNRPKNYRRWESSNTKIYYMNGMKTDGKAHQDAAKHIATLANQDVRGIFCPTMAKGVVDFMQCILDWARPVGRGADLPIVGGIDINDLNSTFKSLSTHLNSEYLLLKYASSLLVGNPASQSLFKTLWEISKTTQKTVLICHSQGNLITANALWVLKKLRSPERMGNITVLGLASPNPSWPPTKNGEFDLKLFRDKEDPITWLSILPAGRQPTITPNHQGKKLLKDGVFSAHPVHLYLSHPHFQRELFNLIK
ncbi:hypothetical protein N9153_01030 [Planctomicrobium sp.]|nr:hypothetical protein [Planctomicrobium sp.]